jgi:hypothetical protein
MRGYFLFITLLAAAILSLPKPELLQKETYVFICYSSSAKRYHLNKNCRGLSNCNHEIRKVSLKEAGNLGRTLCGYERLISY